MALVRNFCGFEAGNNAGLFAFSGNVRVIGDGTARTGDFYLKLLKPTAASGHYAELGVSGIQSSAGGGVKGVLRVYVRLRRYPSAGWEPIAGFMSATAADFAMEVNPTGLFRARTIGNVTSTSSFAPLALDQWYAVTIEAHYDDAFEGQDSAGCTVTVEGVDRVSAGQSAAGSGPYTLRHAHLGGWSYNTAAIEVDFDDWVVVAASDADRSSVALPSATRITPVAVTGQGTAADFSGDWRNVLDVPYSSDVVTDQTSAVNGASTTFTHRTKAQLGISGLAALKVYATAKASVAGTHAILIRGTEYSVSLGTVYPSGSSVPTAIDWAITDAEFDAAEFGLRNKTGATVALASLIGEALHGGTPVDLYAGTGAYDHRIGTYIGTGGFQAITGLGFRPQAVLVKEVTLGSDGLWRHARLGGTRAIRVDLTGAIHSVGILTLDADGFTLGPSAYANQSGITYTYLAVQQGGAVPAGWAPEMVWVHGNAPGVLRTPDFVGDLSAPTTATAVGANRIQGLTTNGFQVGTDAAVNSALKDYVYLAWRTTAAPVGVAVKTGTYTGTGGSRSISGLGFSPALVIVKPATAVAAYWRGPQHTGATSQQWVGATATTAITSLDADGFTVGSTLSVSGATHYWIAFAETAHTASGDLFRIGAYLGDGLDNRDIVIPGSEVAEEEMEPELGQSFGPILWAEYATPPSDAIRVMAGVDLADPSTYYGGYKEPRLIAPGTVARALSDEQGQYQGARFTVSLDDTDRVFRDLLDRYGTLANRRLVIRMISDEDRRALKKPRTVAVGIVRDYRAEKGFGFSLEAEDFLALYTGLGSNDVRLPRRTVTKALFPDAPADAIGKPIPILYGSVRDAYSSAGPVAGVTATEVGSGLPQPTNLSLTPSATGGQLPGGTTLFVKVVAIHPGGQSLPTDAASATVPGLSVATPVCTNDRANASRMPQPTLFRVHHRAGGGAITKYRWLAVTGLRYDSGSGTWFETDLSNWGDVHGDADPNTAAIGIFQRQAGSPAPERLRLYYFNMSDFHPQDRPQGTIGVSGDTGRVCRFVESNAAGTVVYSRKTGGRSDADYAGDAAASGFAYAPAGDDGVEGTWDDLTNFLAIYADDDGEDYYGSPVGAVAGNTTASVTGSVGCSWTAAAGATSYRIYWTTDANWSGTTYYADTSSSSYTITELGGSTGNPVVTTREATYMVTAIMTDGETPPSTEVTIRQVGVALPNVLVSWTPKPNAQGYYVYRRQGSQDYTWRWTISANPAGGEALRTFFVDDFDDSDATSVESGAVRSGGNQQGVVPLLFLGPATDQLGTSWHRFLVAGHACTRIVAVYQSGQRVDTSGFVAVPGQGDWTSRFGAVATDIGGERFTFVYARGSIGDAAAAGTAPLTADVDGIETVGDGSGTLITDLFEQYEHFLRNWVLRDYRTGAWATSGPTWGDAPDDIDLVDSSSFAACKAIASARVAGGYPGAFIVGVDPNDASPSATPSVSTAYRQETVRTWIARLNQSADCFCGFSRKSQFVVRMLNDDPATRASAPRYTAGLGILQGTFELEEKPTTIENQINVRFKRHWAVATWTGSDRIEDLDAQARIAEVRPYQLDLWAVRSVAHATDIARRRLERRKFALRTVRWESDMGALTIDLGDLVRVSHPEGVGALGWTDRPCVIMRHEFDPARFVVRLEALDVQYLFVPAIANVGFFPPASDALVDQGAEAHVALTTAAGDPGLGRAGPDFDLAVLDAAALGVVDDPAPEAFISPADASTEGLVGDPHTLGP